MSKILTPSQTELVAARAALVEMKAKVKYLAAQARAEKSLTKQVKADLRQVKRANAIAKAQARLEKLMSKPAARSTLRKAAKKPSKVVVTKMEMPDLLAA
jgi:hypothetical protein